MKYSFKAEINKVGINPCVRVPARITDKLSPTKGYIPVKGKINNHSFIQTLVPVKNAGFRLYVNGPMLKGSGTKVGNTAKFTIEQNFRPNSTKRFRMPAAFKKTLDANAMLPTFKKLTPSRRKEILSYLNSLKTEDALTRNIDKIILGLKNIASRHTSTILKTDNISRR